LEKEEQVGVLLMVKGGFDYHIPSFSFQEDMVRHLHRDPPIVAQYLVAVISYAWAATHLIGCHPILNQKSDSHI
jgi:hypothetical protein